MRSAALLSCFCAGGKGILAPSTIGGSLLGQQKRPTGYNYSFGIQQQLGRSTVIDVSYAGSIARHLLWKRNINATPMGSNWVDVNPQNADPTNRNTALPANFLRPYTGFGDINLYEFGSTSSYNSAQVSVNRRFNRGVLFGFSYTFSKALGTASSDTSNVDAFLGPRSRNYGPLSYDRTHNANLRYSYAVPKLGKRLNMRTLGLVTDGWELSGTGRFRTGAPFTPGFSQVDFVDVTGSTSGARVNVGDPSAEAKLRFTRPARGEWGNAGPGILRMPGTNLWDTSLFKSFKTAERLTTQLRLETYNTFNHTNFTGVNTTARFSGQQQIDPTFLDYTAASNQRRVQLALRLNW
ncbi:MAG: hypothetical protein SGI92_07575 [Bryobacteraceae bacterium]|nr:hypothetical protein [Bryobacteraceae bacterium]